MVQGWKVFGEESTPGRLKSYLDIDGMIRGSRLWRAGHIGTEEKQEKITKIISEAYQKEIGP